jgi:hypothetical protein
VRAGGSLPNEVFTDMLSYSPSLDAIKLAEGSRPALGEVVDDAIIDVENIARRLRDPTLRATRSAFCVEWSAAVLWCFSVLR